MARRSRLARRRRELRLTQHQIARKARVTRKTVQRWENGKTNPYLREHPDIASAYRWPVDQIDWLLVRDDEVAGDERRPAATHASGIGVADTGGQDDSVHRRTFLAAPVGSLAATIAQLEHTAVGADTEGQRHAALRLLGHTHHAAGETAFDRLEVVVAADHFHQAHEIGVELGDADMIANAQVQLGDVSRRQGRYSAALRLLGAADRHAATAAVLTRVRHCQTLARAYAEVGERSSFDRSIGQAEELAGKVSPEHHREGDHSPRGIRLERGQGLTLLGDPHAALVIYEQAAPPRFRSDRERGSFLIIHAQALAHAGHMDEGVRLAIQGLDLARSYQSPRHVSRVQRMYDRLVRTWSPSEPALVELRDALAA